MVAEHDGKRAEFEKGLALKEATPVPLRKQIPVRLLYHTAYLDNGRVLFRDDAYGWDENLAGALGMEKRGRRTVRTRVSVSGP